jgi:hypothetical protein
MGGDKMEISVRPTLLTSAQAIRLSAGLIGAGMLVEAGHAASAAQAHMALTGAICGTANAAAHCGWCYAAVALGVTGFAALLLAVWPPSKTWLGLRRVNAAA